MTDRNRTSLDWDDLRYFMALSRHGSLSAAARSLGVNHATVSRRIAALEAQLEAPLFERTAEGYALTAAGRNTLAAAAAMERAASGLGTGAPAADAPRLGRVRVTATPSLSECFLLERLTGLLSHHPGLDLDLIADRRAISLARREADIALRLARPKEGDLLARRLTGLAFGFYARPSWVERLADGEPPCFVTFDDGGAHLPEALWLARSFPGARAVFRTNSEAALAQAARSGCGIALLPRFIGAFDPDLVPIDLKVAPPSRELWLLRRPEDEPAVELVAQFLADLFRRERRRFEGSVFAALDEA
ncbi:LysR family transcriptional regulator [Aquabacter sp. L1I39]|uniref:LysR family transcriptional regulator n=1 Tax=Aquabacter sp. L1I39 TaxID=2820278 RepID=UPI001ADA6BAB|nr:LysR family transcriptional regulator [Aquabacter sp. L1I39]QTL02492.1 LysR family transcriptional regulator [Aquabacter sp. L1I39]